MATPLDWFYSKIGDKSQELFSNMFSFQVPDALLNILAKIGDFLQNIWFFMVNIYVFILIIIFLIMLFYLIYAPVKYGKSLKSLYNQINNFYKYTFK